VTTEPRTEQNVDLWAPGSEARTYEELGAHVTEQDGRAGTRFAVWTPNAQRVSVVGDFNGWEPDRHPMEPSRWSGVWECFIPGVEAGALYRYALAGQESSPPVEKTDPYAFAAELRPQPASKVCDLSGYEWAGPRGSGEQGWLAGRAGVNALDSPIAIYEVHLGSWMRVPEEGNRWLTYREVAPKLADYAHDLGYTHVQILPVAEYPADPWGYRPISSFAPTSRHGSPQDFMFLIDTLHQRGIGVLLDWVPIPPRRGVWQLERRFAGGVLVPDLLTLDSLAQRQEFGRPEVSAFLLSSALFWLDRYHLDGLHVAGLTSLLRLDSPGGARENREALAFVRRFNEQVYGAYPDVVTSAEESTAHPLVSRPTSVGGLGFGLKWDVGWAHDTLAYLTRDPIDRKHHHGRLTFRPLYAFAENYLLPLGHDQVEQGKGSLLSRMPGDTWQKFANLRLLYGYQYAQPGKKLLFMGGEIGQWREWNSNTSLDWHLLKEPAHQGLQRWVRDLNTFYRGEPALHQLDCEQAGFEWIDCNDAEQSVISFLRKGRSPNDQLLVVCNFTPVPRYNYRVGAPQRGRWEEVLNSDAPLYGGSGQGNMGGVNAAPVSWHGRSYLLNLTLPPLGMIVLKNRQGERGV
jgi:1,4-alpha-glucan branching enzyme